MQRKAAIIASILVCVFTLISILRGSGLNSESAPIVKKGELHIITAKELVALNGEWQFYPNKLVEPNDMDEIARETIFQDVPKKWDSLFMHNKHPIEAGTYHLSITVPEDGLYGFRADSIRHSSRVFVNGQEAGGIGNPSMDQEEFQYREGPFLFFSMSENTKLDVLIHVANGSSPNGGIVKPIYFGKADQVIEESNQNKLTDGFITGGYLLLGLVVLLQYFQQRQAKNELYFSIFCFAQSVYLSTQDEKLIYLFFSEISSEMLLSLQLVFIHASVLFFLLFAHHTFRKQASLKATKWLSIVIIIKILYLSIPSILIWRYKTMPIEFSQISLIGLLAIVYGYILYILFKAYRQKVSSCEYVLIAAISFTCYGVALGIELVLQVEIGRIPVVLFVIMTISLSFYIGHLRQLAYRKMDNLSKELLVQDQLKNEFLEKTSNKIKGPLHTLMGHTIKLMEGVGGPIKQKQQEFILEMQNSGNKIEKLIDDLRYAASNQNLALNIRPVPLEMISEMVQELRDILKLRAEVSLVDDIPKMLPKVLADGEKLKEVIINVLDNAIRHTASGEIRIGAKRMDGRIQMEVTDTGIGMDARYVNKIFDTFYQIPEQSKHDGIGIGLSISREFIRLMNGEIWVKSTKGIGTTVYIRLPIYEEKSYEDINVKKQISAELEMSDELGTFPPEGEANQQKKIVFAGANLEEYSGLIDFLSNSGFSVTPCRDGKSAYDMVISDFADLLIIDLNLQGQSGMALCKEVRSRYLFTELPILILSSTNHVKNVIDMMDTGANDFVQKPINEFELLSKIKSLFAMKESVTRSIHNELSYYQAQITPHFLYNTLNTIIGLSYHNPDLAREALEHLSVYFRSKLDYTKHHSLVSLEEEIELVESYLAIEKIRFGDQLAIELDIDESIEMMLPSMTIQPLVENAVQHGISKKRGGGRIKLSIRQKEKQAEIIIEDNGIGMSKDRQTRLLKGYNHRIGFINPYTKVKLIRNATFELFSEEGAGTKIVISLPYEK